MTDRKNKFDNLAKVMQENSTDLRNAATPEEAYQVFMDKMGEGFTQVLGDAIASAVDVLQDEKTAAEAASDSDGMRNIDLIVETLANGSHASMQFSSPGVGIPSIKKVKSTDGQAKTKTLRGGSVSVTGTYEF